MISTVISFLAAVVFHTEKEIKADKEIKSPPPLPAVSTSVPDALPRISDILQNEPQNQEFKLAPTPAQLGKAPLQRRQSMGKKSLLYQYKA